MIHFSSAWSVFRNDQFMEIQFSNYFSEKHAPNSILKRGKYKGRDIFMYIINSTGIIETSAESRKKLALRTVLNNSTHCSFIFIPSDSWHFFAKSSFISKRIRNSERLAGNVNMTVLNEFGLVMWDYESLFKEIDELKHFSHRSWIKAIGLTLDAYRLPRLVFSDCIEQTLWSYLIKPECEMR